MAARTILVPLTENDIVNIVAFGNRANMKGAEADTWVELKNRLVEATREKEREPTDRLVELEDTDIDLEDCNPGGTA